jgi:hypothetical protein
MRVRPGRRDRFGYIWRRFALHPAPLDAARPERRRQHGRPSSAARPPARAARPASAPARFCSMMPRTAWRGDRLGFGRPRQLELAAAGYQVARDRLKSGDHAPHRSEVPVCVFPGNVERKRRRQMQGEMKRPRRAPRPALTRRSPRAVRSPGFPPAPRRTNPGFRSRQQATPKWHSGSAVSMLARPAGLEPTAFRSAT